MPRDRRRNSPPPGQRFSASRQPKRRGRPKASGTYDIREVARLAEKGVEQADIAASLGLVPLLAADAELRAKFEAAVTLGHATFCAAVAQRLHKEGIGKGRASALLELGRGWLARYSDAQITPEEEAGLVERVEAGLEKLRAARVA